MLLLAIWPQVASCEGRASIIVDVRETDGVPRASLFFRLKETLWRKISLATECKEVSLVGGCERGPLCDSWMVKKATVSRHIGQFGVYSLVHVSSCTEEGN